MTPLDIKRPYICRCNHIDCQCPESKDINRKKVVPRYV